jgi:hypothetical protein
MSGRILTNLESIGDLIGAYIGMAEGVDEEAYAELIIKQAHNKAGSVFDLDTAAKAGAGFLSHAYEFGVAGISEGPTKFADATSPAARLWVHEITGKGGTQEIGWTWRPALQRNPQPTTASTGVPSKYLRKLSRRKYIFWNKARVMEDGLTVDIKPKNGKFLFVPFGKNSESTNPRNFVMYDTTRKQSAITARPGEKSEGTFTAHWNMWWAETGGGIMEDDMRASVNEDIRIADAEIQARLAHTKLKSIQTTNIHGARASSLKWMKKIFGSHRKKTRDIR